MVKKVLLKKCVIRGTSNICSKVYTFKQIKLIAKIKGTASNKVFKLGKNVRKQVVIIKPKTIIQPRKKIKQKLLKTKINQLNLIYINKLKNSKNFNVKTKNVFYLKKKQNKILNVLWLLIIGVAIGFVNGFWGGGGGMICVPTLTSILLLPEKKAHATAILIMLPLSAASFVVYLLGGNLQWNHAANVSAGFVVGGIIGAMLLKNINNLILKIVFSLIIIAGAIKLLI